MRCTQVGWYEFVFAYGVTFHVLQDAEAYLIKRRLDPSNTWLVNVYEFAGFTNELGIPKSFTELVSVVRSNTKKTVRLKHSDQTLVEEIVLNIGRDLKQGVCDGWH